MFTVGDIVRLDPANITVGQLPFMELEFVITKVSHEFYYVDAVGGGRSFNWYHRRLKLVRSGTSVFTTTSSYTSSEELSQKDKDIIKEYLSGHQIKKAV